MLAGLSAVGAFVGLVLVKASRKAQKGKGKGA